MTNLIADFSTPSSGAAALRHFKDQLVTRGWAVLASSDGLTYNSSGDQITADSGPGSLDHTDAWMRIQMHGVTREWLIQRNADNQHWTIEYSVVGFTGGSPGVTILPTATDSQTLLTGQFLPADGSYRLYCVTEDGDPYFNYAVVVTTGGASNAKSVWGMFPMTSGSYPSTGTPDTDPYVVIADYDATNVGLVTRVANGNNGGSWLNPSAGNGTFQAWYRNGLSSPSSQWCCALVPYNNFVNTGFGYLGANGNTGQALPVLSVAGLCRFGTFYGPKGTFRDLRYVLESTTTAPYGQWVADGDGLRYWIRVGDLWLPAGSSAPSF